MIQRLSFRCYDSFHIVGNFFLFYGKIARNPNVALNDFIFLYGGFVLCHHHHHITTLPNTNTLTSLQLDAMQCNTKNFQLSAPLTLSNRFHRMHIFSVWYFLCIVGMQMHKLIEEREEKKTGQCVGTVSCL